MHRLGQFIVGTLLPRLDRLGAVSGKPAWLAETRAEIIEAFLWLHLGVEIGSFPEGASREVYKTYIVPFFRSLMTKDPVLLEEMKRGERYVAHSPESEALVFALPRYATILSEMAMRGDEVFTKEQAGFEKPDGLQGLFQTLSLLYSSFVASPAVRQFTYEVNFERENAWDKDWSTIFTADEVREADISGSASPIALTFAGYLNFWGHGVRCREAVQDFEGSEEASFSDVWKLRDRVSEIQSWRINLRSRHVANRFELIQKKIAAELRTPTRDTKV